MVLKKNIQCIWRISHRDLTLIGSNIRKWNYILKKKLTSCLRVKVPTVFPKVIHSSYTISSWSMEHYRHFGRNKNPIEQTWWPWQYIRWPCRTPGEPCWTPTVTCSNHHNKLVCNACHMGWIAMILDIWNNTVLCPYNFFFQNPHNRHSIARPWGRGMECRLWIYPHNRQSIAVCECILTIDTP